MLEVALLTWRHQRGALIGWTVGLFILAASIIAFYPVIGPEYEELWESLPEEMRATFGGEGDLGTVEGFLAVEYLSYIGIVYAIFAISQGSRALAGEEQEGTFDVLLAQPVTRVQVVLQKVLATTVSLVALGLASSFGLVIGGLLVGVDADLGALLLVGIDLVPLSLVIYCLALLGSALFHQRGRATLLATVYAVGAYFVNLFAPLAPALDPMKYVSIFYYHGRSDALHMDVDPVYWVLSLALSAVLVAAAAARFHAKDLYG